MNSSILSSSGLDRQSFRSNRHAHWPVITIENITHVVTKGTTPTTYGMPFTDEGVNFIRAEALNGDSALDRRGFRYISHETHTRLPRSILQENDILVTIAGVNVGRCGYVRSNDLPANINQAVGIVRVNPQRANPRFVYYFFKLPSTRSLCLSIGGQAAQPNVNLTNLKAFEFSLPSRSEQTRVADILSAYDDLIDNNRRRIALLEQAARELYREWFVRFRFPGHENIKIVDGLPEGWERKTLREVAVTNAQSYRAKEVPETLNYIDISSVSAGRILKKKSMDAADAPGRARRKATRGDVIWSNVRPNLKAYSLVLNPEENDVFSTGFSVLSATKIPFTFLYQSVTSDYFVTYLVNHTTGASYPAVRPDDFERAEIVVPPSLLLTEFHEICESKYHLIAKLAERRRTVDEGQRPSSPTPDVRRGYGMNRAAVADLIAVGEGITIEFIRSGHVGARPGDVRLRQRDRRRDPARNGGRWRVGRGGRSGRESRFG